MMNREYAAQARARWKKMATGESLTAKERVEQKAYVKHLQTLPEWHRPSKPA